jgi:hypothetical protein
MLRKNEWRKKTKQDESKEKGGKIKLEINESKREN